MWGQDPCEKKLGDIAAWSNRLWNWMLTQIRGPKKIPWKKLQIIVGSRSTLRSFILRYNPPKVCIMLLRYQHGPLFGEHPNRWNKITKLPQVKHVSHSSDLMFTRWFSQTWEGSHLLGALRALFRHLATKIWGQFAAWWAPTNISEPGCWWNFGKSNTCGMGSVESNTRSKGEPDGDGGKTGDFAVKNQVSSLWLCELIPWFVRFISDFVVLYKS